MVKKIPKTSISPLKHFTKTDTTNQKTTNSAFKAQIKKLTSVSLETLKAYSVKTYDKIFSSYDEGFKYAQQKCTEAINCSQPYEHAVVLDTSNGITKSLYEQKGNGSRIELSEIQIKKLKQTSKILHGHPSGTPVSIQDFAALNSQNFSEIIAFNKSGEMSSLAKGENYTKKNEMEIKNINENFYKEVLDIDTKRAKEEKLSYFKEYISNKFGLEINEPQEIKEYSESVFRSLQESPEGVQKIHKFWKKHAPQLGLKYETNYSELKYS